MTEPLSPQQRKEVVALILTMNQSISASRSDMSALEKRVSIIESAQAALRVDVTSLQSVSSGLNSTMHDLSASVANLKTIVNTMSSTVATMEGELQSCKSEISNTQNVLSVVQTELSNAQSGLASMTTSLSNLTTSVNANAVAISGLKASLNSLSSSIPTSLASPLTVSGGILSLSMNRKFCGDAAGLNSYSTLSQMQSFNSNVPTSLSGTNLSTSILVHSRGGLTVFNLSTTHAFTPTSVDTKLTIDCRTFTPSPSDWSVLIPKPAFQSSNFLCTGWMCVNDAWIPASVIGAVDSNPKVMFLHLTTRPSQRITGLVIYFSIDT
ncbi:virus-cell attachment protein sigma C [Nelson Bay orthoreovirus]|uniref:Virus-cell attachment protein sigma C n=1 Tax=Nelson Bay orthoreovirus TaxID=118027 RepID=Q9J1B0_9REOV|nr:virus-cell attachment protein sigma C [Nelson Bay orthoreovirus]